MKALNYQRVHWLDDVKAIMLSYENEREIEREMNRFPTIQSPTEAAFIYK